MDNILKIVVIGASVLLVIGLISTGIFLYSQGGELVKKSEGSMQTIGQNLDKKEYEAFNNTVVSGSQVINAIRMYGESGKLPVGATTLSAAGTETVYDASHPYSVVDPLSTTYINPTGKFQATTEVNSNKVISKIKFVQIP